MPRLKSKPARWRVSLQLAVSDTWRMSETPTLLGLAYTRSCERHFGILPRDRLQHLYVIGQTGTGKSTLLNTMARQDIDNGHGLCLVDPHGDLAQALAGDLPDTAIYWDVADAASPYGYNPLTRTSAALRPLVASGLIEALKQQWSDAWGVRMEHLLRHAILALLEQPCTDMRDIMRLFLDRAFRQSVTADLADPQLRQFWQEEYVAMNYKTALDGVAPIANKLGAFLAHPVLRRAICEPEHPLRFRQLMDGGGILVVNLSKGRLGADVANVLGGLIVGSVFHAALTRHDVNYRRPVFCYVDEFHSFTTVALADMLAEVRKYGVGLTLSQQHTMQSRPEVFAGIMGNVGSLVAFRTGVPDVPLIARQLGEVAEQDLLNLPNYRAFVRLQIDGQRTPAFSARTIAANKWTGSRQQ